MTKEKNNKNTQIKTKYKLAKNGQLNNIQQYARADWFLYYPLDF